MRKTNEQSIKDALDALFKAYGIDVRMAEKRLINAWPNICGPMIARYTSGIYISNKKLYLKIDNAVVREELIFSREKLMEKLNAEAGSKLIEEIIIR